MRVASVRVISWVLSCGMTLTRQDACAQAEPATLLPAAIERPDAAARLAGVGEFAAAANTLEQAAPALPADARAVALGHAARLRLALNDAPQAERDIAQALELARAEPAVRPRVWALVEHAGVRCERAAPGEPETGASPAAIERRARLRECLRIYRDAEPYLGDDAPVDVRVRLRVATARVARALGDLATARELTRRAIAIYRTAYPDDPAADFNLDGHDPYEGALEVQRREAARLGRPRPTYLSLGVASATHWPFSDVREGVSPCGAALDGVAAPSVRARACDAAAEGRMALALDHLRRLDSPPPAAPPGTPRRAYDEWVAATLVPWVIERQFRVGWLALPLTGVVNTGRASWAPPAFAAMAQALLNFARVLQPSPPPPEIAREPGLLYVWNANREEDSASSRCVDAATEMYRRCAVAAASAYEAAWLHHCEQRLHEIDRGRFPLPDEITPAPRAATSRSR